MQDIALAMLQPAINMGLTELDFWDMTKAAGNAAFGGIYRGGWMYMPCLPGEGRAQTPETRPSMAYSDSMEEPP